MAAFTSSGLEASQISRFLTYIRIPQSFHNAKPPLSLLNIMHTHMMSACPYENLSIHYNKSHSISLDPQYLYQKIVVENRGRGGYCMELAILYNHVLRGLGFDAYTAGARTRKRQHGVPYGDFPGWVHIVNIVSLPPPPGSPSAEPEKYAVDVAFGGDGPTQPLPLVSGHVHQNLGQQEVRLVRDWIPTQVHRTEASKQWIYQYRNGAEKEWLSYYCFPEIEFMPVDWDVVNYATSANPQNHHTWTVLVVKFLRHDQVLFGKRMMVNGTIKENLGGKTAVLAECSTEGERIAALKQYFDINLSEKEAQGIRGWASELKSSRSDTGSS